MSIFELDLHDRLPKYSQAEILANVVFWWGEKNHNDNYPWIGYDSADPWVIDRQLSLMQAVGIDGVVGMYYGARDNFAHQFAGFKEMVIQCHKRGMTFFPQFDAGMLTWRPDKSVSELDEIKWNRDYLRDFFDAEIFDFPKYLLNFGLPDFAVPEETILLNKHTGFTWPETVAPLIVLENEYRQNRPPIGCMFYQFDDHQRFPGGDPTRSVWGGPARYYDAYNGQTLIQSAALTTPYQEYVQLVTWNDYEEGTAMESMLAGLMGVRIV